MKPLDDRVSEMLARITATDRLVRHSLLAMDRMATTLGMGSLLDEVAVTIDIADAGAAMLDSDALLEWERAAFLMAETLVGLRRQREVWDRLVADAAPPSPPEG